LRCCVCLGAAIGHADFHSAEVEVMNVGPATVRTLKSGRFDASMISMIRSEESNYMTPVQVR
jgi:hypothetical protein